MGQELVKITKQSQVIKFEIKDGQQVQGRAFLYLIYNDLHAEPYGLMENVFVYESQRGKGIGSQLVRLVVAEAKALGCYKLVATVRMSKGVVCSWYEKFGFKNHGVEFRMDLI